ncbi:YlzJ-like protein [Gracilibacillus ureilyticus]|uniref:YlzJ-like protein n=1 Tax=Gracilibacillus ureilyticus TaxID=531814 RepID=A0A1H9L9Y4_9BACI|nr:YlzJ-like family protein [Gracilibacillus ureilyticus]SER07955.1 YlzJ-like protein [Gracilibacillus ureilyticus]
MIYTPLMHDEVFPGKQNMWENYQYITYNNKQCIVEKLENGDWRIAQLLSTNPNDFLLEEFLPGTVIQM